MAVVMRPSVRIRSWASCRYLAALAGALFMVGVPSIASAQDIEVVRGVISGVDKKPIEGVTVTIIGLLNQQQRTTTTSSKGLYTALFQDAQGEYIISVRRIGYAPQSLHVLRTGLSSILATNITMSEVATVLDDRTVTANRGLVDKEGHSIGGNDRDLLAGALLSLDPSDLLALAANVPGVMMIPGSNGADSSYSVLGMGGDANNLMVDGSAAKGNNVPSMSVASASLATNTYDIMRGGFSGGQMNITTKSGTDIFVSDYSTSLTNNHLTWSDPNSTYQAPSSVRGSMGTGGPIIKGKVNYFTAMDITHSATPAFTLFNSSQTLLGQYGVLPDTVAALRHTLEAVGIPLTLSNLSQNRTNTNVSGSVRLDFHPKAATTATLSSRVYFYQSGGAGYSGTLGTSTSGTQSTNGNMTTQLNFSGSIGGLLNTMNASVNYSGYRDKPYLNLPSGTVRIGSVYADGRTGLSYLRFGGSGYSGGDQSDDWGYNLTDEFSVITTNSKHRMKIGGGITGDHSVSDYTQLGPGGYSFLSLEDLAAGKPSSFSRQLTARKTQYSSFSGFTGVQDEFLASQKLQLSIGVRFDFARPGEGPQRNPLVDSLFGYRNDVVPTSIGVIPRIGFSWTPTKGNPPKPGKTATPTLTPAQALAQAQANAASRAAGASAGSPVASIPTGPLPGTSAAKLLTFTGGIGLQRGVISPYSIQALVDATGLPGTSKYLSCVGDATPAPVWSDLGGDGPTSCLDGSGPVTLSNARPRVSLFDKSYKPQARWSANLGMSGFQWQKWVLQVTGTYNIAVNMPSSLDLNLRRDTSFRVSNEANRPVYVDASNIVASSGVAIQNASRVHSEFGVVSRQISDLQNRTAQFQFSLTPPRPLFGKIPFTLNYTYIPYQRVQLRGTGGGGGVSCDANGCYAFGGAANTDGDPYRKEWAPGLQATHQINTNTSYKLWWFTIGLRLGLTSGIPYTPMVSGDINGDGSSNDRAFIYNPTTLADTAFAGQLKSLLAGTSPSARDCLKKQFGTIAGRNSCRTPWFLRTDISLTFTPPRTFGFGDRLKFTANMLNAGSAIVRLAGMENSILGRSQASQSPNSTLLFVTGFDPATQQFKYRVNQLFGLAQNYGITNSRTPPFQLQVGASWRIGGPPRAPMASGLGLVAPKKDPPLTVAQVKLKLRELSVDPVAPILKLADSLHITPEQSNTIGHIGDVFWTQADSLLAPLAEFVVSKGAKMTDIDLNTKLPKTRTDVQKLMSEAKTKAMAVLTPAQKALYAHFSK